MKYKRNTVGTDPKSNCKIVETERKNRYLNIDDRSDS